jgi:NDP-4-keto-2,6-dideoxyhexose 3-C-methyltransferase
MLTNMNFYDICHEHLSYYSLDALQKLMARNGLAVLDASTNAVNGGSLRAFITHADNARAFTDAGKRNLAALADGERALKIDQAQTYRDYFRKIEDLSTRVNKFLDQEIRGGGRIFGLGASTKGNVLLQFFGITKERMPTRAHPDKVTGARSALISSRFRGARSTSS